MLTLLPLDSPAAISRRRDDGGGLFRVLPVAATIVCATVCAEMARACGLVAERAAVGWSRRLGHFDVTRRPRTGHGARVRHVPAAGDTWQRE